MERIHDLFRPILLITVVILFAALPAMAQLVPIPDLAFRTYLQTNHPEVMVGDQLNTDAPELGAITTLSLMDVADHSGLEYFFAVDSLYTRLPSSEPLWPQVLPTNLEFLSIEGASISAMAGPFTIDLTNLHSLQLLHCIFPSGQAPEIPVQVEHLMFYNCQLNVAPAFPENLGYLEVDKLQGFPVPAALPSELDTLHLYADPNANFQEWIDLGWPPGLKKVLLTSWGSSDEVLTLPAWPSGIEDITIYQLDVQEIPALPAAVHRLFYFLSDEGILTGCLPSLPLGLEELVIGMPLTCLPNKPPAIAADPSWDWAPVCTIWNSLCLGGNEIQGTVFNDLDNDGIFDGGENGMPNGNVVVQPGNVITSAATLGDYSAWVSAGEFTVEALPYLYQTPSSALQTASFSDVGGLDTGNDLGLFLTPNVQDLVAGLFSTTARPGFENVVWLDCQNVGTTDVNGTLRFTFDMDQSYVNATPVPASVNGNVLEWSIATLMGGNIPTIEVVMYTDPAVPIGTPLTLTCFVEPIPSDETPANNSVELVTEVAGSYDPNDKLVQPLMLSTMELAEGRKLDYTIRFQNTGTFHAEDVLITDMLSDQLDPLTFQFAGSSHPCQWYITDGQLQIFFDQIMLPDSAANEVGSHGFVSFRIAPLSGLMHGTTIENNASIIFDFNAPIVTEPAVFTVSDPTGIPARDPDFLDVYPNPVTAILWLRANDMNAVRAEILDVSGRVVMAQGLDAGQQALDVSGLPVGMYQVRVIGASVASARFVKH